MELPFICCIAFSDNFAERDKWDFCLWDQKLPNSFPARWLQLVWWGSHPPNPSCVGVPWARPVKSYINSFRLPRLWLGKGHDCPASALLFVGFSNFNVEYFQYIQNQNFIYTSTHFPLACILWTKCQALYYVTDMYPKYMFQNVKDSFFSGRGRAEYSTIAIL